MLKYIFNSVAGHTTPQETQETQNTPQETQETQNTPPQTQNTPPQTQETTPQETLNTSVMSQDIFIDSQSYPDFIVDDEKTLETSYNAISKIRDVLETISAPREYKTGFTGWPTPNPIFMRTNGYLVLGTGVCVQMNGDVTEQLGTMYTPFGEVHLMSGGLFTDMVNISKEFMDTMDMIWTIEDCTDKIKFFQHYDIESKCLRFHYPGVEFPPHASGFSRKFYLIKNVDHIELPSDGEIIVAQHTRCTNSSLYENSLELFKSVSGGKNQF
jgi:hypothetical protein